MEMSQFGKSFVIIMLLLTVASYYPSTSAMVVPIDLKDVYPDMSSEDYCLCSRSPRLDKRNNELIHNLDRIRGIMNMG